MVPRGCLVLSGRGSQVVGRHQEQARSTTSMIQTQAQLNHGLVLTLTQWKFNTRQHEESALQRFSNRIPLVEIAG